MPYHAAASARAILAFKDETFIQRVLRAERFTEHTLSEPELIAELARVRQRGVAVIDEELEAGVGAIARPVRVVRAVWWQA